jgi:hypothetical protein
LIPHARESGYVLLGVTIILVIMGIFMGMAVPVWQHVMQREREEELLWRGRQYVQAIELYQKKHPGAYPPNVEILVEQKFLRKAYEDPMAEDGEWKVLRQLSPEIRSMMTPGGQRGRQGRQTRRGRQQQMEQEQREQERERRTSSFQTGRPRGRDDETALGGVVGVVSTSEEETIRIWEGKTKYNEWLFVYAGETRGTRRPGAGRQGQPGQQPPGAPGAPGTPGSPGPGQRPNPKGPGGIQNPRSPSR